MTKSVIIDNNCPLASFDYDINLDIDSIIRITPEYCVNAKMPVKTAGAYSVLNIEFVVTANGLIAEYFVIPVNEDEE